MTAVSIGLTFPGTCEKAFTLYRSVFGGEFTAFIRYGGDPATDAATPKKDKDKIAYVEIKIGGVVITGDDTLESSGIEITPGNNMGITYEPDSKKEADRVFKALSPGARIISPNTDFPWGYCGGLVDRYGIKWALFCRTPQKQ
jgi:PhnB protein